MSENIMLSIYTTTYGHEKYIGQALDSILMQKTSYSYEVLVGEDASPDGTRAILKEYERKYPGKFQMFYREKNMNNSEITNSQDLKMRCKGKYVIALEGDDFWTDERKIQKQIDFLETHPECIAVSHNCVVVDENSNPNGEKYPECGRRIYRPIDFALGIMPGQLATVMYRNIYKDAAVDKSLFKTDVGPGDIRLYFTLLTHGKFACIQEKMSAYRHVVRGGHSYSATLKYDFEGNEQFKKNMLLYARKFSWKEQWCSEVEYAGVLVNGFKRKQISVKELLKYSTNIHHKLKVLMFYPVRYIYIKLFQPFYRSGPKATA